MLEEPVAGSTRVSFGVWSNRFPAAEQLRSDLRESGEYAITVTEDCGPPIDCLVVLTQKRHFDLNELATLVRLANRARITVAVDRYRPSAGDQPPWPRDATLYWGGRYSELPQVADTLVDLIRPPDLLSSGIPALLPTDTPLPDIPLAAGTHDLIEQLRMPEVPRIVAVTHRLLRELLHSAPARNRSEYNLSRLARWSADAQSQPFINLRLTRSDKPSSNPQPRLSLENISADLRTRRLVMLFGDPGTGKTRLLRYFDAQSALRSVRPPDGGPERPDSFYVSLARQPLNPDISIDWLSRQWTAAVDPGWCDLRTFLTDGGVVLLDGLDEGNVRSAPLRDWLSQWRDVITQLCDAGAARVVVSCRTRDQQLPMREPATEVSLQPLSTEEIVAIAAQADARLAQRFKTTLATNGRTADLYANPSHLRLFLGTGMEGIPHTSARLFGLVVAGAILRAPTQLHDHQLSNRSAAELHTVTASDDGDPWQVLETIPRSEHWPHSPKSSPCRRRSEAMPERDHAGPFVTRLRAALDDVSSTPTGPPTLASV
ncbi:NACHT domain-containing protein [Catenuloplanes indicus]|uniref:NACHT domain-containing protein n=1 Tax=Catenuloplanes indicus TaxID=137267 RepID=A0AAE3VWC3_9ACTN|nr:hypothetical protein [Catenuloplanes indicus]MDQ0365413.1 hypothetical protein [Catenuloplanes indicus]